MTSGSDVLVREDHVLKEEDEAAGADAHEYDGACVPSAFRELIDRLGQHAQQRDTYEDAGRERAQHGAAVRPVFLAAEPDAEGGGDDAHGDGERHHRRD